MGVGCVWVLVALLECSAFIESFMSTGVDPHICATCTSYECMLPADACPVWLKTVTFTEPERLAKSKRSVRVLASYHISA